MRRFFLLVGLLLLGPCLSSAGAAEKADPPATLPSRFVHAEPYSEGRAVVSEGMHGPYGFLDAEGQWAIPPRFNLAGSFHDGLAWAVGRKPSAQGAAGEKASSEEPEWRYGYIDPDGNWALAPVYLSVKDFAGGRAWVRTEPHGYWSLIDKQGRVLAALSSREAPVACEGLFLFERDGLWGVMDADGAELSPPVHEQILRYGDGLAPFRPKDGKLWGFLDRQGKVFVKPRYEQAFPFAGGRAVVCGPAPDACGLIDNQGRRASKADFDFIRIWDAEQQALSAEYRGKKGLIDRQGSWLIEPQYTMVGSIGFEHEGTFYTEISEQGVPACLDERHCGLLNPRGEWIIRPEFKGLTPLSEGMAVFASRTRSESGAINSPGTPLGYVDASGAVAIGARFLSAYPFKDGKALVRGIQDNEVLWFYIDKSGKTLDIPVRMPVGEPRDGWQLTYAPGAYGPLFYARQASAPR